MPQRWRFVALGLSIFAGMTVGRLFLNGGSSFAMVAATLAGTAAVYGLVYLVWREQQRRHGTA